MTECQSNMPPGHYLDNIADVREEKIMVQIEQCQGPASDIWDELVKKHPGIELNPHERPKSFTNMIHELLNWIDCCDDDWNPEKRPPQVPLELVKFMKGFFDEHISEGTMKVLRKAIHQWADHRWGSIA